MATKDKKNDASPVDPGRKIRDPKQQLPKKQDVQRAVDSEGEEVQPHQPSPKLPPDVPVQYMH